MKLRELFFKAKSQLDDFTTIEDIYWLIEDVYHYSRGEVPMHYEDEIDDFVFFWLFPFYFIVSIDIVLQKYVANLI